MGTLKNCATVDFPVGPTLKFTLFVVRHRLGMEP